MTEKQTICLLTGLPDGFLAQKLLAQLLVRHPEMYVLCLVADAHFDRAHEILSQLRAEDRERVEPLRGDVSAMDFGMSGAGFLDLAARVDVIHHCTCANQASIGRDLEWRHYVGSTGEVLELAAASGERLQRLVHWSSALLFAPQNGRVTESANEGARPRSRDDEMRFRADTLVRDSMSRVPITLLRPSIVAGDSKTGELDRNEGTYALLQLIVSSPRELRLPLPGRGDQPCHFVPLDYVLEAGLSIADHPQSVGRTFHITDERPTSLSRVFDLINEAAERPPAPPGLARNLAALLFHAPGLERFSQIPRNFLELLASDVSYDSRNTREILAGTGIECPPVTSYIRTMVERVRRDQEQSIRPPRKPRRDPHFEELDDPLDAE
jgi:thioester reductase-like protein